MRIRLTLAMFCAAFVSLVAIDARATCTVPNTFVNGVIADANQVNSNFAALLGCANANPFAVTNFVASGTVAALHMPAADGNQTFVWTEAGSAISTTVVGAPATMINMTNLAQNNKHGYECQSFTTSSSGTINTNCFAGILFTPPDNGGDGSVVYARQMGGGNAGSFFRLQSERPTDAIVTGTIAGTVLTVTGVTSGTIHNTDTIYGSGVSSATITSLGTGTGGIGTYNIDISQSVAVPTTITVRYPLHDGHGYALEATGDGSGTTAFISAICTEAVTSPCGHALDVYTGNFGYGLWVQTTTNKVSNVDKAISVHSFGGGSTTVDLTYEGDVWALNKMKVGGTDLAALAGAGSIFTAVGSSGAYGGGGYNGIAAVTTGTGIDTDSKLMFGVVSASYAWIQSATPGTAARGLALNPGGGNVAIGAPTASAMLDVSGTFRVTQASPAAADACSAGQIVGDTTYLYTCSASGAWKRVAMTGGY